MKIEKLPEKFIEITPEEEDRIMCRWDFICAGYSDYEKIVNSKIKKYEIGYMIKNGIRERYILRYSKKDLKTSPYSIKIIFTEKEVEFK